MAVSQTTIILSGFLLFMLAAGPGLVGLWYYQRGLSERIDDLESLRLLDAAEISRMHNEVNELRRGVSILSAQVRRAGMQPEWTPEAVPVTLPPHEDSRQAETNRLVDLWQRIADRFSMDEIADLAFRLGLPESNSDTAGGRARELVAAARRRGLLDQLVDICRDERPNGGF
jgi:hypothetical protein